MGGSHIGTRFKHWLHGEFAAWEFENDEPVPFCPLVTIECHKEDLAKLGSFLCPMRSLYLFHWFLSRF